MARNELRNSSECEEILKRNAGKVFKTALIRTGNRYDAEDIMQEVFLRFIRYAPVFPDAERESAWFIKCTVNLTHSFFRSARIKRELPLDDSLPAPEEDTDGIIECVMKLPKNLRTAIHLYYYENMSVKEIADSMGKSESAVKSLLMRGRNRLKDMLKDEFD